MFRGSEIIGSHGHKLNDYISIQPFLLVSLAHSPLPPVESLTYLYTSTFLSFFHVETYIINLSEFLNRARGKVKENISILGQGSSAFEFARAIIRKKRCSKRLFNRINNKYPGLYR